MPTSSGALQIFLILMPGFAAAYLVQFLALRSKQTDLDKLFEALLFSFLICVTGFYRAYQDERRKGHGATLSNSELGVLQMILRAARLWKNLEWIIGFFPSTGTAPAAPSAKRKKSGCCESRF